MGDIKVAHGYYQEALILLLDKRDLGRAESKFKDALEALGSKFEESREFLLAIQTCRHLAEINKDQSDLKDALQFAKLGLHFAEKFAKKGGQTTETDEQLAQCYRLVGMINSMMAKISRLSTNSYEEAIRYYLRALSVFGRLKNYEMLAYMHSDLAYDAFKLGASFDYYVKHALASLCYFQKALEEGSSQPHRVDELHLKYGQMCLYLAMHIHKEIKKLNGTAAIAELGVHLRALFKKFFEETKDKEIIQFIKVPPINLEALRKEPDVAFILKHLGSFVENPEKFEYLIRYQ